MRFPWKCRRGILMAGYIYFAIMGVVGRVHVTTSFVLKDDLWIDVLLYSGNGK